MSRSDSPQEKLLAQVEALPVEDPTAWDQGARDRERAVERFMASRRALAPRRRPLVGRVGLGLAAVAAGLAAALIALAIRPVSNASSGDAGFEAAIAARASTRDPSAAQIADSGTAGARSGDSAKPAPRTVGADARGSAGGAAAESPRTGPATHSSPGLGVASSAPRAPVAKPSPARALAAKAIPPIAERGESASAHTSPNVPLPQSPTALEVPGAEPPVAPRSSPSPDTGPRRLALPSPVRLTAPSHAELERLQAEQSKNVARVLEPLEFREQAPCPPAERRSAAVETSEEPPRELDPRCRVDVPEF